MVDLASLNAALTGLNTAANIGNSLLELVRGTKAHDEVIKLNAQILSAQQSAIAANSDQFALLQKVRALEEEVAKLKAWDTEKQNYALQEVGAGNVAYVLKPGVNPSEAMHKLCPNCYARGEKSFLHSTNHQVGRAITLTCGVCRNEMYVQGQKTAEHSRGGPITWGRES